MIKHIKTSDLRRMQNQEGLILQGCGGSLQEWVDGINQMLTEAEILKDGTKFKDADTFEHDGLTCLLFPFDNDVKLDVGKLAIWRLRTHENFGGTWLSDYVNNRLGGFTPENKLSFVRTFIANNLARDVFALHLQGTYRKCALIRIDKQLDIRRISQGFHHRTGDTDAVLFPIQGNRYFDFDITHIYSPFLSVSGPLSTKPSTL